ncbi:hypothetical protein SRS16CHR_00430 [Variovorax sp. SRS16]|uniref:NIPSNAP family protein n=1 Tax=Variovorax sp. SRS16 TaxID=282217 RepID=UPI00131823F3|nr:NIPSNAP family protein [Variovorax sp. SRS16]VTU13190.1 hypothetical protein SRS16CHR_00430 [Variovorax sp. SRS16]
MIVEMRTYQLRPGTVPTLESLFREHLPHRTPLGPLGGLWHTTTGQLDTAVHMWPYESIEERMDVRAKMIQPGKWPPPLRPILLEMKATILLPAPFSPPMLPARHGQVYELCVETYLPGGPADCVRDWSPLIDRRQKLSPLVFCGTSEFGALNEWVHLWAYRDMDHRAAVREELDREGWWPPSGGRERLIRQQTQLLEPAECSPLA